jgi:hypothetical protein
LDKLLPNPIIKMVEQMEMRMNDDGEEDANDVHS